MKTNLLIVFVNLAVAAQPTFIDTSYAKTGGYGDVQASDVDRVLTTTKHKIVATTKYKILRNKTKQLEVEAIAEVVALGTPKAILALEKKDTKAAKDILASISGKLDSILAKNPGLSFIPADVVVDVKDYEGTSQMVASAIDAAKNLLKQGNYRRPGR